MNRTKTSKIKMSLFSRHSTPDKTPDQSKPWGWFFLGLGIGLVLNGSIGIPGWITPATARAEDKTPLELFQKAEESQQLPRFQGKKVSVDFSYTFPQISYWNISYLGRKRERLERLSAQGKQEEIMVITGKEKLHYLINQGLLVREITRGGTAPFDPNQKSLDLARRNYSIETVGTSQVGQRKVVRVHLRPHFSGRPRQEIWIDPEVGLSLRSEVYGKGGNLSSLETFSEVEINPTISEAALKLNLPRRIRKAEVIIYPQPNLAAAAEGFRHPFYIPESLPRGFVLQGIVLNRIGPTSRLQLIYSDGLTSLSIFQEKYQPAPDSALSVGPQRERSFVALSRGLTKLFAFHREDTKIVVVGEIDRDEINRVVESLKPAKLKGGKSE